MTGAERTIRSRASWSAKSGIGGAGKEFWGEPDAPRASVRPVRPTAGRLNPPVRRDDAGRGDGGTDDSEASGSKGFRITEGTMSRNCGGGQLEAPKLKTPPALTDRGGNF